MARWLTGTGKSRSGRTLSLAAAVVLVLLTHASGAAAYLSSTGAGTGSTHLPTLNGPSSVTVSQSGSTVTISWGAATLNTGSAVQGYRVTRSDAVVVCGSPTLVTVRSCTDSGPPSATYTYTVDAVYNSWDASTVSLPFTVLTAPAITSQPASLSNSASASFSFSGGGGTSYQCQLDGGAFTTCSSPASYSALSQGAHTFAVRGAAAGGSTGPATSYSWTVDTIAPTQSLSLTAGASGAYLTGTTLYYRGSVAGSFKLTDTVVDAGSGPASAAFPSIATTGWTHGAQTVSTPAGGPYTSSPFSWSAGPSVPAGYTTTGADAAGNTAGTSLTFVNDITAPSAGALTVNGTAASAAGSTSQANNSTSFTIVSRTDYADAGSGLKSSVLTVQSESLSGTTCGAPGSGGPFTTATTVTGTTQPSGIAAGYCYLYTLTGTDNVGNSAAIHTTVVDNALSFSVTSQVTTATAGVATSGTAIGLKAIKNGTTDTTYAGATLSWSGAAASPSGALPTLPSAPTWSSGVTSFGITLVNAQTTTLTVTDGTRSVTFSPITVSPGTAARVAWTGVSSPAGVPSPCLFTCTYASGFGGSQTWTAHVSVTDIQGNTVSNIGVGVAVVVTLGGNAKGAINPTSPATLAIPSSGAATSSVLLQYTSVASGSYTDTLTATSGTYTSATASFTR